MLWKAVDVLAVVLALGLLVVFGPEVIGFKKWRRRLFGHHEDHHSNASPRRDSSSST
jgi:hypothetical protein